MVLGRGKFIIETSGTPLKQLDSVMLKLLCDDSWFFRSESNNKKQRVRKQTCNYNPYWWH